MYALDQPANTGSEKNPHPTNPRILRTGVEGLEEYLEDFDEPMTSLHFWA